MGVLSSPESLQRLTPYESVVRSTPDGVRSTALAHRFMVRRSLTQFRGGSVGDLQTTDAVAQTPVRTLDTSARKSAS